MTLLLKIREGWRAIRWKMLFIFVFFSMASTLLTASLAVALLNVVVRRESAYLVEERIKAMVGSGESLSASLSDQVQGCPMPTSEPSFRESVYLLWPGSETHIATARNGAPQLAKPNWLDTDSFAGLVVDQGNLEIRSLLDGKHSQCATMILAITPVTRPLLRQLSQEAGLQISETKPVLLRLYRAEQNVGSEIAANFIPGSKWPIPVVITARNWQTGDSEDWVVCQVSPSYARTIEDLGRMGLRPASWVAPLAGVALALMFVYTSGLILSVRLSQQIVGAIDGLSHAAHLVGKGDFSVRLSIPGEDQLGRLASSFNAMSHDLEALREQEKQAIELERDITLARELQRYLYPAAGIAAVGADVWGINTPARLISGDWYDFFQVNEDEIAIFCADVSGKGVSAAFIMSHLQALVNGWLLPLDQAVTRPAPNEFVKRLNRDLYGRFGDNRYATMFYGEFNCRSNVLRYVNAGHCPAILVLESGEPIKLSKGDLPVGLFADATYQELQVNLSKGCVVVIYTDGVTDALNAQGEEFGEVRLLDWCAALPHRANAEAVAIFLSRKVAEWTAGVDQVDDITILALIVT